MLDFAMLPPEAISGRMYSGPGSGPMMAAAAAWDVLTGQLNSFALGYSSVISELQDEIWSGAASEAMVAAAAPYVAWVTTTATLTEQAASQSRAAAAAYETAFAATVPPAVVTANRTQLATLVATNFFGQNTPLIAATEAAYAQMWAQDAAAMYGYAVAASAAAELTPFREPPKTTNAAAQSAQPAAQAVGTSVAGDIAGHSNADLSQLMSAAPQQLNAAAVQPADTSPSVADAVLGGVSSFNTLTGPEAFGLQIGRTIGNSGSFFTALAKALGGAAPKVPAVSALPSAGTAGAFGSGATLARHAVLASMGEAAPMAQLSVPRAWADATPVAAAAEQPLWLSEEELAAASSSEGLSEPGMVGAAPTAGMGPMTGMVGRSSVSTILRVGPRRFTMPRPSVGG